MLYWSLQLLAVDFQLVKQVLFNMPVVSDKFTDVHLKTVKHILFYVCMVYTSVDVYIQKLKVKTHLKPPCPK
jgi:hypothetical protein